MALTAAQTDEVIDKVSALVGGDDRGMFAFVLRAAADQAESQDQFAYFAMRMLEKHFGPLD
jgi:hypothetical protein